MKRTLCFSFLLLLLASYVCSQSSEDQSSSDSSQSSSQSPEDISQSSPYSSQASSYSSQSSDNSIINTQSCDSLLLPIFLSPSQKRALSLVITSPSSGRVAYAKEEVSVNQMCADPLECSTIVPKSYMPILYSDDVTCANGKTQLFNAQVRRGLFFDPFGLIIRPSGLVTFSPAQSFCRCSLKPVSFNLTCSNGHIFGFDDNSNMYQFLFENITTFAKPGSACTNETVPTSEGETAPLAKRSMDDKVCQLSASLVSNGYSANRNADENRGYSLNIQNTGNCQAREIRVDFIVPNGVSFTKLGMYEPKYGRIRGLQSLETGEEFTDTGMVAVGKGPIRVAARCSC